MFSENMRFGHFTVRRQHSVAMEPVLKFTLDHSETATLIGVHAGRMQSDPPVVAPEGRFYAARNW